MKRPKLTTVALVIATLGVAIAVQHTSEPAHAAMPASASGKAAPIKTGPVAAAPVADALAPLVSSDPSDLFAPQARVEPVRVVKPAPPVLVATADGAAGAGQPPAASDDVRGVVRAVREATLSSRLAARIVEMPLSEGASFKAGTLLVRFDCERQTAEARAAAAAADAQKKTVDTNVELDKFESIGKNDLAVSRSVFEKANAESDALKVQLKDCNLYAPFSGRVTERMARNFEAVTVSQPLLKIVDTSALELDVIVPSTWLRWLADGATFQFRVDETGQTIDAKVLRVTPTVDPVSKTIRVIGQFREGNGLDRVLPGMSGTASFAARNG